MFDLIFRPYLGQIFFHHYIFLVSGAVFVPQYLKTAQAVLVILCMDPLIRNLNENKKIEPITFKSKLTHTVVKHKASGYADDIAIVCRSNLGSVQEVFFE